ncbi:hypothetical protein TWF173_003506 [Orbilia oligospora]|nr:hypothetical protein TWF173_003506 [Orbilia oligospora]
MQNMIKRKPVANGNPSVDTKQESQAKTPIATSPTYRIPRKPLSPVAVVPKAFIWPTIVETTNGNLGLAERSETTSTTSSAKIENVDGSDHKAFLAKAQNSSIEHETYFRQVYTRESVVSGDTRPPIFDTTAIGAEVPTDVENATIVSQPQHRNSSISQSKSRLDFENSEITLHSSTIETSAKGDSWEDGKSDVYEEFTYRFEGESRALTLISTETLLEKIDIQQKMILDTGFACGNITRSSVGPISKMVNRWFTSQNLSGWPFHFPADLPFESTAELDNLLLELKSNEIDEILADPIKSLLQRKYWNMLWKISIVSRCVCNQLFSTGTIEDLYLSYTRMPVNDTIPDRPVVSKLLISALSREFDDAISKNLLNKGYILLKAGLVWNGAQSVLKHLYHYQLSYFSIDECHQFRNAVLLGFWKQFLENIASGSPRLEPLPFDSIIELFCVLQGFERPHEPPRYFPNSHPDLQYLVTTNFSTPIELEKYKLVRKEDEYLLQEYLISRQRAIRNKEWDVAITIIDQMLSSIYPGVEEAKRWLAVKAYLLAIIQDWNGSISIQQLLQQEPLNTNDRLRLELYFTNSMTALVHQRNSQAARSFCAAAIQLPDFIVSENERVCDRKNADILYGILDPNANWVVENKEDHIRCLQKALSAWGQGGHLFEPGAPFHFIMSTPIQ